MKHYIVEEKKIKKATLDHIVCDMCGEGYPGSTYTTNPYEISETTISLKEGERYPEYQGGTDINVDLCPDCFKDKLLPWLRKQGCHITTKEWENW